MEVPARRCKPSLGDFNSAFALKLTRRPDGAGNDESEQLAKLIFGDPALVKDVTQRAGANLPVHRNDGSPISFSRALFEGYVAPFLA